MRTVLPVLLLAATAACGSPADPPADAGATDASAAVVDAPGGDAGAVPMIDEALAAQCGAYTPAPGIGVGDDLHKVTLTDPGAVCNDGTPGVMYVRPSVGGASSGRWVIYLQGGSNCGGIAECTIRYCGVQKYTKAKMSSRWTPMVANTDGQGLLDRDGTNPFGDVNAVVLYYCSSDGWTGTKLDTILANPNDPSQRYRLHFRGHAILEAAIAQLSAGVTSDDRAVTMPALTAASSVLLTGSSAGASGAEHHADWLRDRLAGGGTIVRAAFDANLPINPDDLDPAVATAVTTQHRDLRWPQTMVGAWGMFVDESCRAMHAGDDPALCGDQYHVVMNHVTTPFIARQDLRDGVIGGRYLDNGATMAQMARSWATSLARLPEVQTTAEEAAAIAIKPGLFGPNCNQHVGMMTREYFQEQPITPVGGAPMTWRGAILAWLSGQDVALLDTQPSTLSTCPAPVDTGE